ncbi:alpha/beta fold hydrolase [Vibrio taketomensis]|uniref:alpha/beta fold hydrolase n=1 Tax=Vibrio taketomensis TaxID=2572923 RepID=UPI001389A0E4|nr:alpha/beta fold hydrolase [Vibrio taketomensis]
MSQLLNYKLEGEGHTIVLIHGLFGNLDNLGLLARNLKLDHQVLSIDLRNHGQSFQSKTHTYQSQAEDVCRLLEHLNIRDFSLIGHSMGGKVAMKVAELMKNKVRQLVVLDIAPVDYQVQRHDNVFNGLKAVNEAKPSTRKQALEVLAEHIEIEGVRQFLGKSLYKQDDHLAWRFNVENLWSNYRNIMGWQPISTIATPTLFVKGANSDYLQAEHQSQIQAQFSQAKAHIIANTGHWLHAEKPEEVLRTIRKFIA